MTDGLTPVRFDLSSVDVHRNQAVFEHLAERGAYFELDGDVLVVPARYAAAVADLLFPIERPAIRRIGRPLPPRDDGLPRLAPIATRPFGWLVDLAALVVAMVMLVSLLSAGGSGDGLRPGVPIVAALLVLVAPIVRRGNSPGGALVGIRIVTWTDSGRPGWSASIIRWIVPWSAVIVPSLIGDLVGSAPFSLAMALLGIAAWSTVHLAALVDSSRRGLHDRLAGTVLVRA